MTLASSRGPPAFPKLKPLRVRLAQKRKPARPTWTIHRAVSSTGSHNRVPVEPKASEDEGRSRAGDVVQHHTSCRQKLWRSLTIFVHLRQTPSIGLFFAVDAIVRHRLPKNDGVYGCKAAFIQFAVDGRGLGRNARFRKLKAAFLKGSFLSSARKAVSPSPPASNRPSGERRSRLAARPPRKRRGTRP
jgi:hypothetical protein